MTPKTAPLHAPHFSVQNCPFGGLKWTPKSPQIVKNWLHASKSRSWAPASKNMSLLKNMKSPKTGQGKKKTFSEAKMLVLGGRPGGVRGPVGRTPGGVQEQLRAKILDHTSYITSIKEFTEDACQPWGPRKYFGYAKWYSLSHESSIRPFMDRYKPRRVPLDPS